MTHAQRDFYGGLLAVVLVLYVVGLVLIGVGLAQ